MQAASAQTSGACSNINPVGEPSGSLAGNREAETPVAIGQELRVVRKEADHGRRSGQG